jgi:hypothetical protein
MRGQQQITVPAWKYPISGYGAPQSTTPSSEIWKILSAYALWGGQLFGCAVVGLMLVADEDGNPLLSKVFPAVGVRTCLGPAPRQCGSVRSGVAMVQCLALLLVMVVPLLLVSLSIMSIVQKRLLLKPTPLAFQPNGACHQ